MATDQSKGFDMSDQSTAFAAGYSAGYAATMTQAAQVVEIIRRELVQRRATQ